MVDGGGGGGGAGAVGYDGGPSSGDGNKGHGGVGVQVLNAGPPSRFGVGTPGPSPGGGWFAGGGAGGTQGSDESTGGAGGGANGGDSNRSHPAVRNSTGINWRRWWWRWSLWRSWFFMVVKVVQVVVRYQIGTLLEQQKQLVVLLVSTIVKRFILLQASGTFTTAPGSFSETVDYTHK